MKNVSFKEPRKPENKKKRYRLSEARENALDQLTIEFGFASDWLR